MGWCILYGNDNLNFFHVWKKCIFHKYIVHTHSPELYQMLTVSYTKVLNYLQSMPCDLKGRFLDHICNDKMISNLNVWFVVDSIKKITSVRKYMDDKDFNKYFTVLKCFLQVAEIWSRHFMVHSLKWLHNLCGICNCVGELARTLLVTLGLWPKGWK